MPLGRSGRDELENALPVRPSLHNQEIQPQSPPWRSHFRTPKRYRPQNPTGPGHCRTLTPKFNRKERRERKESNREIREKVPWSSLSSSETLSRESGQLPETLLPTTEVLNR